VLDDDAQFRAYVSALLETAGFEPAVAIDGLKALASIRARPPAAAILDVNVPGISGYEVCRAIREEIGFGLPVLFVSVERTDSFDRVAGLTIGGDDYLIKPFAPDELLARLRSLLRRSRREEDTPSSLTRREREVLELLALGLDQVEIAERLVISPKTVARHIEGILFRLDAHSRAEAVALAYRLRLVPVPA